ncbi:MAG: hypothetical protein AB8B88_02745 [Devosiaceae bacterium]
MRLFSSKLRQLAQLGAVAAGAALLAGCASYGSFDENEPSLEQSVLGGLVEPLGITGEEEPIDYSARAPLVAPPATGALPPPSSATAVTADPNWPTGSRERMAQVLQAEDQTLVFTPGVDGVDIAATQALAERTRNAPVREVTDGRRLTPAEMRREQEIHEARAQATAQRDATGTVRGRRFLTDPPVDSRTPSPEAPYGAEAEVEEESGGWWPF